MLSKPDGCPHRGGDRRDREHESIGHAAAARPRPPYRPIARGPCRGGKSSGLCRWLKYVGPKPCAKTLKGNCIWSGAVSLLVPPATGRSNLSAFQWYRTRRLVLRKTRAPLG